MLGQLNSMRQLQKKRADELEMNIADKQKSMKQKQQSEYEQRMIKQNEKLEIDEVRAERRHSVDYFMYQTRKDEMNKRIAQMDQKVEMALMRKQQALDYKSAQQFKKRQ